MSLLKLFSKLHERGVAKGMITKDLRFLGRVVQHYVGSRVVIVVLLCLPQVLIQKSFIFNFKNFKTKVFTPYRLYQYNFSTYLIFEVTSSDTRSLECTGITTTNSSSSQKKKEAHSKSLSTKACCLCWLEFDNNLLSVVE